jgi:twitching motility protein PilI
MNQRTSLREFQQQLHKRLQGDSASDTTHAARLGVLAAGNYWLIRLDEAQEVLAVGAITPVPLTKPWFRGLVNVRGNLFSVVDFAQFTMGQPAAVSVDARLVLVAERFHVSAALLVEKMLGLRTLASLEPDEAPAGFPWACARWRDADGRAWREISIADLVHYNDFLQAGL